MRQGLLRGSALPLSKPCLMYMFSLYCY